MTQVIEPFPNLVVRILGRINRVYPTWKVGQCRGQGQGVMEVSHPFRKELRFSYILTVFLHPEKK